MSANKHEGNMNPDREPLSTPTASEDDGIDVSDDEELLTPPTDDRGGDESSIDEDEEDDDDHSENIPSSPPTSVETPSKSGSNGSPSVQVSSPVAGAEGYRAPEVETEDEDGNDRRQPVYSPDSERSERCEAGEDPFSHKGKAWESSSQWEDDEVEQVPSSSPLPNAHQSPSSSRKSALPLSSPLFPPRARQSQSSVSVKSQLSHRLYARPSPASRASSGSYDHHRDERKAPLVLLHITLLLLPGAEEIVLRHVTPTTFERGLLVEHPRGDYNLLEEMILDGLGLDDENAPSEENASQKEEEPSWEKALNVPSTPGKRPWQLRVYASNGLMTPGAWKRVWSEMERIDVEIWPRGFDRTNKCRVGLSSPPSAIAAAIVRGNSLGGRATAVAAPLPLELESPCFAAADHDDIDGDRNGLLTNRNVRRDGRKGDSGGLPNQRNSNRSSGGLLRRLSQPATPVSPKTNVSTPRSSRKHKHRSSPHHHLSLNQFSVANAKFYLNKFTTPKAVKILAGINLLLFLYFTLFRPFIGAATSSITWFNSGGDEAICAVGDAVEVAEPLPAGCVEEKFDDDKELETVDPDPLGSLGSLDEDDLHIEEDKDGEETEDLGELIADPVSDDDLTPFMAGDQSSGDDEDGTNAGEGEEKSTSEDDSDQFQYYLAPDDTEEEKQKSGSFPWGRWGDEIKDKLSF